MKIYVGTSGYSYKEWKGGFYPEKVSPKEMLHFYSERFGVVEINNTFYHMPTEAILTSWEEQVPHDFIFVFKAPQIITHLKRLKNAAAETEYFLRTISMLGAKLGPVLFQFPRNFRADPETLKAFLSLVPRTISCAFEFRSSMGLDAGILNLLRDKGSSLCVSDADEAPAKEIVSTAPWGYLRLRRSCYSDEELVQWLKSVLSQKWTKVFVFFKHDEEAKEPGMAMRFRDLAAGTCLAGR